MRNTALKPVAHTSAPSSSLTIVPSRTVNKRGSASSATKATPIRRSGDGTAVGGCKRGVGVGESEGRSVRGRAVTAALGTADQGWPVGVAVGVADGRADVVGEAVGGWVTEGVAVGDRDGAVVVAAAMAPSALNVRNTPTPMPTRERGSVSSYIQM